MIWFNERKEYLSTHTHTSTTLWFDDVEMSIAFSDFHSLNFSIYLNSYFFFYHAYILCTSCTLCADVLKFKCIDVCRLNVVSLFIWFVWFYLCTLNSTPLNWTLRAAATIIAPSIYFAFGKMWQKPNWQTHFMWLEMNFASEKRVLFFSIFRC